MPNAQHPAAKLAIRVDWGRIVNLTLWVLQALLAVMFLYFGASKLGSRSGYWVDLFAKIGVGQWFRIFTGVLEVVCSLLLLIPRTAAIAAALLACAMVGAVVTHLLVLRDGYAAFFPGLPLLLLVLIAWRRAPRRGSKGVL